LQDGAEVEIHPDRLERIVMSDEPLARETAAVNYEIVVAHGLDGGVGFGWNGLFIHNPFVDPQYGTFDVDPLEQYGDAYTESTFVTDPASARQMAQRQLREKATADLARYCLEHELPVTAVIRTAGGMKVAESHLESLSDEQIVAVWSYVDALVSDRARIDCLGRFDGE
jgi:hypothetical protein